MFSLDNWSLTTSNLDSVLSHSVSKISLVDQTKTRLESEKILNRNLMKKHFITTFLVTIIAFDCI